VRLESTANDPSKNGKMLINIQKQTTELKKKDSASLNEDQKNKITCEAKFVQNSR